MSLNIQQFKAQMGTPAKLFNWSVFIPNIPTAQFKAQSTQIPAIGSTDIDLFYQGETIKYAGAPEYEHTWTIQIAESQAGDIWNAIWLWRQLVYNQTTGISGPPALYKSPITVLALNDLGVPWLQILIKGAYPKNVDAIDIDRSNNTESWKWNVTFNFDNWDRLG